jgi:hypothetical protein
VSDKLQGSVKCVEWCHDRQRERTLIDGCSRGTSAAKVSPL